MPKTYQIQAPRISAFRPAPRNILIPVKKHNFDNFKGCNFFVNLHNFSEIYSLEKYSVKTVVSNVVVAYSVEIAAIQSHAFLAKNSWK